MGNAFDRQMSDVAIAMLESEVKEIKKSANTGSSMEEFLDFFYPVGSYYETSDANFDPNSSWGGTWELETSGQVHVGAGAGYTIGATGGSSEVTLTAAQSGVPAHGHGFTAPTVSGGGVQDGITGGYTQNGITGGGVADGSDGCITGGSHRHQLIANWSSGDGSVDAYRYTGNRTTQDRYTSYDTHTHALPNHKHDLPSHKHHLPGHTHTVSGGSVDNSTAANASSAHTNMQPYIVVNRWHRTA